MREFGLITLLLFSLVLNFEIPFQAVNVEGVPKYPNIKPVLAPLESFGIENKPLLSTDESSTTITSNVLIVGSVMIGSRRQQFNFIMDTGSAVLWVPKVNSKDQYPLKNHFNPQSSSTCKATNIPFSIKYGTGATKGYYYLDVFRFIKNKQFVMKFGVCHETVFRGGIADGILGLSTNYDDKQLSFIHILKQNNIISEKKFSFKFTSDTAGKMYFGKHGDFSSSLAVSAPLVSVSGHAKIFYTLTIKSFTLKRSNIEAKANVAANFIFDTGTNVLLLPKTYYNQIKNLVDEMSCKAFTLKTNEITVACIPVNGKLPDVRFNINGNTFIIPGQNIFYTIDGKWASRLYFWDNQINIIGTPFFRAFHTLFDEDNRKLSFYPMKKEYIIKS